MAYLKRFIIMLQFMTTIPIRLNVHAEKKDFGKGLSAAPVVGLVIGTLLACGNYLLGMLFPPLITAVLTFALYIGLTGGLHLDGLGDTADGLFSNRPRERVLEIMKDSRVGTNAVLVLMIVLFVNISILSSIQVHTAVVLLLMPVAGRIGSLVGAGSSGYAGISDGPGRWCIDCCGLQDVVAGLVVYFIIFITAGFVGFYTGNSILTSAASVFLVALIPPVSAYLLARLLGRRLGGVTGDILGAVCELNQTIFLLVSFLLLRLNIF